MYQPTAPGPCSPTMPESRSAMSVIASSQPTCSKPAGVRRSGMVTRSASLTTSVKAMPFWHANPVDSGWSLSGRNATSLLSSTVATMPHSGSQMRQNVTLCSTLVVVSAMSSTFACTRRG